MSEEPIYFYVPADEYGWLSNFAPYGVEVEKTWWPTVEHFFQASKFLVTDPAHAEAIRKARTPKDAARMGRDRGHKMREDWESVKDALMKSALSRKFATHPSLKEKLLETGDRFLAEASPGDRYWGIGADGSGQNRLGILLMDVRSEIRRG